MRIHRPSLLFWLLTCGLCLVAAHPAAAQLDAARPAAAPDAATPDDDAHFKDVGVQITSLTLQGSTFTKDPAGRDLLCTVIRGQPAKLLVFDAKSGELLQRMPLAGANGAWNATTASDGTVYTGTDDNGHLYRWTPGEAAVSDLGEVGPNQTFAWDVAAGREGEVFVATYPGCRAIRYHPRDGFADLGAGSVAPPEQYARGIAFDPAGGKVYVGVGTKAHVIELDPGTRETRDLLPKQYADKKFAYSVRVAGGKLFALLTDGGPCLVIDPATRAVEAALEGVGAQLVATGSPYDEHLVYLKGIGRLLAYDLRTKRATPVAIENVPSITGITAMAWVTLGGEGKSDTSKADGANDTANETGNGAASINAGGFPGETLVIATARGRVIRYHPVTGKSSSTRLDPPPESTPIHYIARGPDGRIYTGGYLSGGLSAFDPKTGRHEQLGNSGQTEGITTLGGRLYLGVYPQARLFSYDPAQPWGDSPKNPKPLDELDRFDQDRPFAALGVEKLGKVFFGTVPDYGRLGGVLAVHDATTGRTDVHEKLIPDQSIVSLAYADDLIVGGTSVSGGLGIPPTAKEARLFLWDPATGKKVFEATPVAGATIITGLMTGPDGSVWGVADGKLFGFDVAKREIVFTKNLLAARADAAGRSRWREAFLAIHPDGRVYGTARGRLFRIDPATKAVTILRDRGANLLALDDEGRVYFSDRANLWQYTP